MRILVTGGAGYVGVMLSKALLEDGHDVTILDNFMYGYDSVLHLVGYPNLKIITYDIRNDIASHVRSNDVIYHLAGISGYPACESNPSAAQLTNVVGTENLIKDLSKNQILVYASTTSFYGKLGEIMDEESVVEPISIYGQTKYRAEQIVMEKDNSIALRLATIFGVSPRMRLDLLVNDFTYKAVNERCIVLFESKSGRTFLHIEDAIRAYLLILERIDTMKGEVYNIGSSEMNFNKFEVAETIKKHTGCTVLDSPIKDLDRRNFTVSYKKIENIGYKTKFNLDDGVRELVKLYSFYRPLMPYKPI